MERLAYDTVREKMSAALDEPHTIPGMVGVIQTFSSSLKWTPHIHSIGSRGVWTPDGEWLPVPYADEHRAELLFRHKILALLRDRGLLSQETNTWFISTERTPIASGKTSESKLIPTTEPSRLLYRVYEVDPLTCDQCSGEMKILAFITDPSLIRTILDHRVNTAAEPRAPPLHSSV